MKKKGESVFVSQRFIDHLERGRNGKSSILGLKDGDNIVQVALRADLSGGVVGEHDANLDTNTSLAHQNVTDSSIRVLGSGVTTLDHVTVVKFHSLGTLSTQLSTDNNLNSLGGSLHDEADNSVASTPDGEAAKKLELEGLGLGLGAEATVGDTLGVKLDGSVLESEPLLDDGGELADALSLLSENGLGAGGTDDDLGAHGGSANLNSGVAILGKLPGEELVELSVENSVSDELPLLGLVGSGHFYTKREAGRWGIGVSP